MATHSSILAWRTPQTEEPGGLQPTGHKESDTTEATQRTCMQVPVKLQMLGKTSVSKMGKNPAVTGPLFSDSTHWGQRVRNRHMLQASCCEE